MGDIWTKTLWIYGLATVVSLVIALVIKGVVAVLGRVERRAESATPAPATPAPAAAAPAFDVTADHIAAISAAVYAMVGSHRIVHIEHSRHREGWLAEGRHAQHASHDLGHRGKH